MDMGERDRRVREHLWHDIESEHRSLARVLVDVECLVEDGSFETARRRFGEYRLAHERHLNAERQLEEACAGVRELVSFLTRLHREQSQVLEQSERVWTYLCREKGASVRRMLDRLASLVAEHENAQRRLILADLPLPPERRSAQGEVVRRLGHL
jgi:hypothetical protein